MSVRLLNHCNKVVGDKLIRWGNTVGYIVLRKKNAHKRCGIFNRFNEFYSPVCFALHFYAFSYSWLTICYWANEHRKACFINFRARTNASSHYIRCNVFKPANYFLNFCGFLWFTKTCKNSQNYSQMLGRFFVNFVN